MAHFVLPILGGEETLVDEADRELVSGFNWRAIRPAPSGDTYAMAQRGEMYLYMHRLIAGAGPKQKVDHINGNGLDNRRLNLRAATSSQNSANAGPNRRMVPKSSRYKGVCWDKSRRLWTAHVHYQGRTTALGRFAEETAAARAYNEKAIEIWGDFARLNPVS